MPAIRLKGPAFYSQGFDVIGEDGAGFFVRHVGLAAETEPHARGRVAVHQMGPPLEAPGIMAADVQAFMDLTEGECRKMQVFVDLHAQEHAARRLGMRQGYCIFPHHSAMTESDGTITYTRFSCAGFAIEAYRFARLEPMDLSATPMIGLDVIASAYPEAAQLLKVERLRSEVGLTGEGPWPVVLCGYFVHAFDRPAMEIRRSKYMPVKEDLDFPRGEAAATVPL